MPHLVVRVSLALLLWVGTLPAAAVETHRFYDIVDLHFVRGERTSWYDAELTGGFEQLGPPLNGRHADHAPAGVRCVNRGTKADGDIDWMCTPDHLDAEYELVDHAVVCEFLPRDAPMDSKAHVVAGSCSFEYNLRHNPPRPVYVAKIEQHPMYDNSKLFKDLFMIVFGVLLLCALAGIFTAMGESIRGMNARNRREEGPRGETFVNPVYSPSGPGTGHVHHHHHHDTTDHGTYWFWRAMADRPAPTTTVIREAAPTTTIIREREHADVPVARSVPSSTRRRGPSTVRAAPASTQGTRTNVRAAPAAAQGTLTTVREEASPPPKYEWSWPDLTTTDNETPAESVSSSSSYSSHSVSSNSSYSSHGGGGGGVSTPTRRR